MCALLHYRYSNEVATTFKGLHQPANVGSLHLRAISKSNRKPKETREQHKVQIGQQQQLAEIALPLLLAKVSAGSPTPRTSPPSPSWL